MRNVGMGTQRLMNENCMCGENEAKKIGKAAW